MLATDNLAFETNGEKDNNTSLTKISKPKKTRKPYMANSNGIIEPDDNSLSESIPSKFSKNSEIKNTDESTFEISTYSQPTNENSNRNTYRLDQTLTSADSYQSTGTNSEIRQKFQQIELNTVTDDDDDHERERRKDIQPLNHTLTDRDTMVSSYTTNAESDVIEIHEFSLADIDAYLDIYFDTLINRLRHFIGDDDQIRQFRSDTKNRINSNINSREYRNVLLGKMNGEVVAAVTLSFPGETTTVLNDNIPPKSNACLTSIRRWMIRQANYIPVDPEECYIEMIGVKTAYQNHGIGAAMLECVEHFARQAGANLLTVHISGEQLRNYFSRFGFNMDHSDNSAFWKWIVERQSITKMSKTISPDDDNNDYPMDNIGSYTNESMVGSETQ